MALCETVAKYYPNTISFGVVAGKYYLEAAESEPKSGENSDEKPPITVNTDTEEKDNTGLIYQMHEKFRKNSSLYALTSTDIGELKEYISPNEDKKTCPSSFCTDMRKGSLSAEKIIMSALARYNCFTLTILKEENKNKNIEIAVSYMLQKGYLRTYKLEPYSEEIYFASPRLLNSLSVDSCSLLDIKPGSVKNFIDFDKSVTAEEIASALAYAELAHAFVSRNSLKKFKSDPIFYGDSFCSVMEDGNDTSVCELGVGVFWSSDKNCSALVNSINSMISKYENLSRITVASIDYEHAYRNSHFLMDFFENCLMFTKMYVFSFKK